MTNTSSAHGVTWRRNVKDKTVTFRGGNLTSPVTVSEQYMLGKDYDNRCDQHQVVKNMVSSRIDSFIARHYDPSSPTGGLDAKTVRLKRQRIWDKVNNSQVGDVFWFAGKKLQVAKDETVAHAIIAIKGGMILVHWNADQCRWFTELGSVYNDCHKHRVIRWVAVLDNASKVC